VGTACKPETIPRPARRRALQGKRGGPGARGSRRDHTRRAAGRKTPGAARPAAERPAPAGPADVSARGAARRGRDIKNSPGARRFPAAIGENPLKYSVFGGLRAVCRSFTAAKDAYPGVEQFPDIRKLPPTGGPICPPNRPNASNKREH